MELRKAAMHATAEQMMDWIWRKLFSGDRHVESMLGCTLEQLFERIGGGTMSVDDREALSKCRWRILIPREGE